MVGDDLTPLLALLAFIAAAWLLQAGARRLRRYRRRHLTARKAKWRLRGAQWGLVRVTRLWRERVSGALPGKLVAALRVVDGDTLDDPASGIRYRIANIDCPETEERAGCHSERIKGEQAKCAAEITLADAARLEIRSTGRKDIYGRTVAHLRVDGRDFGDLMIKRGFARRWNGKRRAWCGDRGGLAILAKATGALHVCSTCRAGASSQSDTTTVIAFPIAYRKADGATEERKP